MLLEEGFERLGVLARMQQAGGELATAGAEQRDGAVRPPIDADVAAELLVAARAGAVLGRELGVDLVAGDAAPRPEPAATSLEASASVFGIVSCHRSLLFQARASRRLAARRGRQARSCLLDRVAAESLLVRSSEEDRASVRTSLVDGSSAALGDAI